MGMNAARGFFVQYETRTSEVVSPRATVHIITYELNFICKKRLELFCFQKLTSLEIIQFFFFFTTLRAFSVGHSFINVER